MSEEVKRKGWRGLVDEAMTKIVREEIAAQIEKRFPPVQAVDRYGNRQYVPGFGAEMGRYIEHEYQSILSKDPEVKELLRQKLKAVLVKGFEQMPE